MTTSDAFEILEVMKILKQNVVSIFISIAVIAISFFGGAYAGYVNRPEVDKVAGVLNIRDAEIATKEQIDFEPFWRAWNILNEKYSTSTTTPYTAQDKVWGAIKGLAE